MTSTNYNSNSNSRAIQYSKNASAAAADVASTIEEMKRFNEVDMPRWRSARYTSINTFKDCAAVMDSISKGTSIAKVTGGLVGFAGGVVSIIGLCVLNPVVVGVGVAISAGGGVTSLGSALTKAGYTRAKKNETMDALKTDQRLFEQYSQLNKKLQSKIKIWAANASLVTSVALNSAASVNAVKGLILAKNGMDLLKNGAIPLFLADDVAKQLIYPSNKLLGLVSVEAASVLSKTIVIGGSVLSVAVGMWEMFAGAREIINGSDVAQEMRATAGKLAGNLRDVNSAHALTMQAIN